MPGWKEPTEDAAIAGELAVAVFGMHVGLTQEPLAILRELVAVKVDNYSPRGHCGRFNIRIFRRP